MKISNIGNRRIKSIVLLVCIAILALLLTSTRQRLNRSQRETTTRDGDLYLPQPEYLKFIALGHNGLISDIILAKALIYYGSHYKEKGTFGFKHLKKLFITAIEMDPRNIEAFLIAGNILSDIDVYDAIEVLQLGMKYHPDSWKFPEMIGYHYFFRLNDSYSAAKYYEIAAQKPGHPPYVPSLSGKLYRESGRYQEAIRVLYNFYSTTTDDRLKESFKESIEILKQQLETQDFSLKCEVLDVVAPDIIRFRPDGGNPLFQSLGSREEVRISGAAAYRGDSEYPQERLFSHLQQDYAELLLKDQKVSLRFERDETGQLKRDQRRRLIGTLTMSGDRPYRLLEIGEFPPEAVPLDMKSIHQSVGKLVSIRFIVKRVELAAGCVNLYAAAGNLNRFSVQIPLEHSHKFATPGGNSVDFFRRLQEKQLVVSGLALPLAHGVVIKVYLPVQINRI